MENFEKKIEQKDDEIYELKKIQRVKIAKASDEEEKYFDNDKAFINVDNVAEDIYLDKVFDKDIFNKDESEAIIKLLDGKYLEKNKKFVEIFIQNHTLDKLIDQKDDLENKIKKIEISINNADMNEKDRLNSDLEKYKLSLSVLENGIRAIKEQLPLTEIDDNEETFNASFSQN